MLALSIAGSGSRGERRVILIHVDDDPAARAFECVVVFRVPRWVTSFIAVIISAALSSAVMPACRIMHLEFCRSRSHPVLDRTLEPATIGASPRGEVFFFKVQRWSNEWAVHNGI
jgi:hypothetical protein